MPNLVILGQTVRTTLHAFLRSLKVSGTDTNRSPTYDFLLVFHSNYSPILYPFQDIGRYLQEIFHTFVFNAPAEGVPLGFCNGIGENKLEWCPYQTVEKEKCDDMSIRLDAISALDRRTDGRNW